MCDRAVVGKTGEHMRFVATDGAASVPAIMFRVPQIDKLINCDSAVDLVFEAVAEQLAGTCEAQAHDQRCLGARYRGAQYRRSGM